MHSTTANYLQLSLAPSPLSHNHTASSKVKYNSHSSQAFAFSVTSIHNSNSFSFFSSQILSKCPNVGISKCPFSILKTNPSSFTSTKKYSTTSQFLPHRNSLPRSPFQPCCSSPSETNSTYKKYKTTASASASADVTLASSSTSSSQISTDLFLQDQTPLETDPALRFGILRNGLRYYVLPNHPKGNLEAHLEVLTGSAYEEEHEQGLSHLLEHVAYMGNSARSELISKTGAQTNACTDFHHTVFFASCATRDRQRVGAGNEHKGAEKIVKYMLAALREVLLPNITHDRVEKERKAVLSEANMINTLDYRVECQVLKTLHSENQISDRFPIGKLDKIKSWTLDDAKAYHKKHYQPHNAVLYIVGDVDVNKTLTLIQQYFNTIPSAILDPTPTAQSFPFFNISGNRKNDPNLPSLNDTRLGSFYPLVNHIYPTLSPSSVLSSLPHINIFRHANLQGFSLHIFLKYPIRPCVSFQDYSLITMRYIVMMALQLRLSINSRESSDDSALFDVAEFIQSDSPREGCSVASIDLVTADPTMWSKAVNILAREVYKMGLYGLTKMEFERCLTSLLRNEETLVDRFIPSSSLVEQLMFTASCGHTFIPSSLNYTYLSQLVENINLNQINAVAKTMFPHFKWLKNRKSDAFVHTQDNVCPPSAIVACLPANFPEIQSQDELLDAFTNALADPVSEVQDIQVPTSLMNEDMILRMLQNARPENINWAPVTPSGSLVFDEEHSGIRLRRLSNGIRLNILRLPDTEPQAAYIRVVVPGGRLSETKIGDLAIGTQTLQENGSFGPWSREQVELFCVDNSIAVSISCTVEFAYFDFCVSTINEIGLTTVFQLIYQLCAGNMRYDQSSLVRAKQSYKRWNEMVAKSLEESTTEKLMEELTGNNPKVLSLTSPYIDDLTLDDVQQAVKNMLTSDCMEVSVVGDINVGQVELLALQYLGSIPYSKRTEIHSEKNLKAIISDHIVKQKHIKFQMKDTEERSVAYIAGKAPSINGIAWDGRPCWTNDPIDKFDFNAVKALNVKEEKDRRKHPLFGLIGLQLLSSLVSRELFCTVRERKGLTYEANFKIAVSERLHGSYFLVYVTADRQNVEKALEACKDVLMRFFASPKDQSRRRVRFSQTELSNVKNIVIRDHLAQKTNDYFCSFLTGIQLDCCLLKTVFDLRDFVVMADSYTLDDLDLVIDAFSIESEESTELVSCIGQTVIDASTEDAVHDLPEPRHWSCGAGRSSGTALGN